MQTLRFFSEYLRQRYGVPLQRIAVDLALGCPNRDRGGFGTGCIFCAENGARARHLRQCGLDLAGQVAAGRDYVRRRYGSDGPYIAYFQAFTATNGPVEKLRVLYEEVLKQADFRMVIVATRPDALPDDVLDYLEELSHRYELWVELGIQTMCDATLRTIRRGHTAMQTRDACAKLHARGIRCAGHLILGLPGESSADWRRTAEAAAELPLDGLKFHQLMVLRHTPLARMAGEDPDFVTPLNEYEYAAGLKDFLRLQPEGRLLMRLAADAEGTDLIQPRWWMKKGQFLQFFQDFFHDRTVPGGFVPTRTEDGSFTLYHPHYRQFFHTVAGADAEAVHKFLEPGRLAERLAAGRPVRMLDVGFGLGGNVFAAYRLARSVAGAVLAVTSLEFDLRTLRAALSLYQADTVEYRILQTLLAGHPFQDETVRIELLPADARESMRKLPDGAFDLIALDGFSPESNPELWTVQMFRQYRRVLEPASGRLLTYSSAFPVRGAMLKNGFFVAETPPFGRKRPGTAGALAPLPGLSEIPEKERNIILHSTAGVPYSDPGLAHPPEKILAHRAKLVEKLRGRGVPKWYKA